MSRTLAPSPRSRPKSRRHEVEEEEESSRERWLVTYADMLTLLMVLFIVLFASSSIDNKKYSDLKESLAQAFTHATPVTSDGAGVLNGSRTPSDQNGKLATSPVAPAADLELTRISQQIGRTLAEKNLASSVAPTIGSRGLVITIVTDKVLFNSGSTRLLPVGTRILDAMAPALVNTGRLITVEGHTDSQPESSTLYPDNWFLSVARAATVVDRLLTDGVDAPSGVGLAAQGYGDTQPVATNATATGRSHNRRVEIIVAPASTASPAPA